MSTKSNRRSFLKNTTLLAGGAFSAQSIFNQAYGAIFEDLSAKYNAFSPNELAVQEDYWSTIQQAYKEAITEKTKIIHVTHVINWVGQIMPVKKICRMAHEHGIEVIVDGAHSFGLLDFKIPELEGDYFGTPLHKYLSAPIGSGMLWIKKEKISKVWPLLCSGQPKSENIRKFETLGTRSYPIEQGIGEALNFHNGIGAKRKEERVRYLKNYWAEKALAIPGVKIHTSLKAPYSCAIAGVSVEGLTPKELETNLFSRFKIHTVAIPYRNLNCVRVSPHVYTRPSDLDRFVRALGILAVEHSSQDMEEKGV